MSETRVTLSDFLDDAGREALFRGAEEAHGLPADAYTDERFWQLERERLFARSWLGCAFETDLPMPASAFPVTVAGGELLLTRDASGRIRAFHNVCRHRAMRVLSEPCTGVNSLRCPWHCWTYDLDGRLLATPGIGGAQVNEAPGIDPDELGLVPVRCDTWLGIVFVDPGGEAPTLAEHLAPIAARLAPCDLSLLRAGGNSDDLLLRANWKLVTEGGVENYHLPWVHPESGGHVGVTRDVLDDAGTYVGMGTRWPPYSPDEGEVTLPQFPHVDRDTWEDLYLFLLPGVVIEVMNDHVVVVLQLPQAHDRTLMRRSFLFIGDAALDTAVDGVRDAVIRFWHRIGEQDVALVEVVHEQQSQRHGANAVTRFAPFWETPVQRFQQWVVQQLE